MKVSSINFLIKLKNLSINPNINSVTTSFSNTNFQIARALYEKGFITSYAIIKNSNFLGSKIRIMVRSSEGINLMSKIKFISTPKKKVVTSCAELSKFDFKSTEYFVFTDKGLHNAQDCIRKNIGGILAFKI